MFKKLKTDVIVPENKSRLAYTIWALLLGCLGVHNFYAGNSEKAKAQLILGLIGMCCCCFPLTFLVTVTAWMDVIYANAYAAVKTAKVA